MDLLDEPELDAVVLAAEAELGRALDAVLTARSTAPHQRFDADAIALRAFLERTKGHRHRGVLRALWGRLGTGSGPALIACGPASQVLAADRYGLTVRTVTEPDEGLKQALGGARVLIDIVAAKPWWGRLLALPELRIIGALPDDDLGLPRALMVSRETSGPTGDDRTFWVTDSAWPEARIVAALAEAGLIAGQVATLGGLKLFVLAGYVQADDGRLAPAPGALKGVIGSAPQY